MNDIQIPTQLHLQIQQMHRNENGIVNNENSQIPASHRVKKIQQSINASLEMKSWEKKYSNNAINSD